MRTLIIAHRGASGYAPESTRAAFTKALAMDIDVMEFDIQPTKDNVLVVFHDYSIKRITGNKGQVRDYTLAQLKAMDCGSWFSKKFAGEKILTFAEALHMLGNKKPLSIDIKDKLIEDPEATVVQFMLQIRKSRITAPILLAGEFHRVDQFIAKHRLSNIRLQYFYNKIGNPLKRMKPLNYYSLDSNHLLATKRKIRKAHAAGLKVFSWILNTKKGMKKQIRRGVDGIYTNYPDRMKEAIDELNQSSAKRN